MKKKKLNQLSLNKTTVSKFQNQVKGGQLVDPTIQSLAIICGPQTFNCPITQFCPTNLDCPSFGCPSVQIICQTLKCPSFSPVDCGVTYFVC